MKPIHLTGVLSLSLLAVLAHLADAEHGQFLTLPMRRERTASTKEILRRQIEVAPRLAYDNDSYLVSVDIGTPKQTVGLRVDVSTHQTWVIGGCGSLFFDEEECEKAGTYNDSLSDTSAYISVPYEESDVDNDDGSSYGLVYYADDFTIQGGDTLKNVTFGIYEYPTSDQFGALGLGLGKGVNSNRSSIIDELVAQGVIQTKAFSLALGPYGSEEGSLILGGVDTRKFSGALQRMPIVDPPEFDSDFDQTQYWINVDGATTNRPGGDPTAFPSFKVLQHSDLDISWLPADIAESIAGDFGLAIVEGSYDWYIVPCSFKDTMAGSLDLRFGDLALSVPYGDLVLRGDIRDRAVDECYLSVMPRNVTDEGAIYWLGQNLMGHLYTVYDQESEAVWLAQYEDCGSEVVGITKDENAIAGIRGQCGGTGIQTEGDAGGGDAEGFGIRINGPTALWAMTMFAGLSLGL